ncbi:MAG: hypothetical protein RLZZ142_822 [Verrucomicrobiota bacterium]
MRISRLFPVALVGAIFSCSVFAGGGSSGASRAGAAGGNSNGLGNGGSPNGSGNSGADVALQARPQGPVPAGVSPETPYTFRQVGYLATVGPAPLRFGPPSPGCNERTPPRVPSSSRKAPVSGGVVGQTQPAPPAEVPPPVTGSTFQSTTIVTGGGREVLGTPTDEVIQFFRPQQVDPEMQGRRLRFMFDPVQSFQSAVPPASAPPSRATFRQN